MDGNLCENGMHNGKLRIGWVFSGGRRDGACDGKW